MLWGQLHPPQAGAAPGPVQTPQDCGREMGLPLQIPSSLLFQAPGEGVGPQPVCGAVVGIEALSGRGRGVADAGQARVHLSAAR